MYTVYYTLCVGRDSKFTTHYLLDATPSKERSPAAEASEPLAISSRQVSKLDT